RAPRRWYVFSRSATSLFTSDRKPRLPAAYSPARKPPSRSARPVDSSPKYPCEPEADQMAANVLGMGEPTPAVPTQMPSAQGSSDRPLDAAIRARLEPRFGHDFSRVRVHTDASAAASARRLNARAYTVGSNIVFAAGRYDPQSFQGQRLIAH